MDTLNNHIKDCNIVLRPNTKYYNETDKITYIWSSIKGEWEVLVKDGAAGSDGKNADKFITETQYYAAWNTNQSAPEFDEELYSITFPSYDSDKP